MTARSQVELLMNTVDGLGYKLSDDQFDFDAVPSSKMDKAYRAEVNTGKIVECSGGRVEKEKIVEFWLAYKITARGDRKTAFLDVLDDQDDIEDALLESLVNLPSNITTVGMSKYVQNYLILHMTFTFTYWRDL
jgi:hypothetical protein